MALHPRPVWSNTCCKKYRPGSWFPVVTSSNGSKPSPPQILALSQKPEVNPVSDLKRCEVHLNLSTTSACCPPRQFFPLPFPLLASPFLSCSILTRELRKNFGQVQELPASGTGTCPPFPSPSRRRLLLFFSFSFFGGVFLCAPLLAQLAAQLWATAVVAWSCCRRCCCCVQ